MIYLIWPRCDLDHDLSDLSEVWQGGFGQISSGFFFSKDASSVVGCTLPAIEKTIVKIRQRGVCVVCFVLRVARYTYGSSIVTRQRCAGVVSLCLNFFFTRPRRRIFFHINAHAGQITRSRSSRSYPAVMRCCVGSVQCRSNPGSMSYSRSCRSYGSHPATWTRSYRSYRSAIWLSCLVGLGHELYWV